MEVKRTPDSTENTAGAGSRIHHNNRSQRVSDPLQEEGSSGTVPEVVSIDIVARDSFNAGIAPAVF
jgi:hypothetical protein